MYTMSDHTYIIQFPLSHHFILSSGRIPTDHWMGNSASKCNANTLLMRILSRGAPNTTLCYFDLASVFENQFSSQYLGFIYISLNLSVRFWSVDTQNIRIFTPLWAHLEGWVQKGENYPKIEKIYFISNSRILLPNTKDWIQNMFWVWDL